MDQTYLITGGMGFIGSHLCERLLARGDEASAMDNFDPFYPERVKHRALSPLRARGLRLFQADIRDGDAVERAFGDAKPECVLHLAALAGVRPSLERPAEYMDVNVRGTAVLLEAARKAGVRRFVHVGTEAALLAGRGQEGLTRMEDTMRDVTEAAASITAALEQLMPEITSGFFAVFSAFAISSASGKGYMPARPRLE